MVKNTEEPGPEGEGLTNGFAEGGTTMARSTESHNEVKSSGLGKIVSERACCASRHHKSKNPHKVNAGSQTDPEIFFFTGTVNGVSKMASTCVASDAAARSSSTRKEEDEVSGGRSEGTLRLMINNFRNMNSTIRGPPKVISTVPWKIMVMPRQHVVAKKGTQKCLGFFLQCCAESYSDSWSCLAVAELRLISQKPGIPNFVRKTNHTYTAKENDWGYSCFMTWADILDESQGYMKDEKVILEVHVKADLPKGILTHDLFCKKIEDYMRLAEMQAGRGLIDKALEVNQTALKFCKDKDDVIRTDLESQKAGLIEKKLKQSIERIEKGKEGPNTDRVTDFTSTSLRSTAPNAKLKAGTKNGPVPIGKGKKVLSDDKEKDSKDLDDRPCLDDEFSKSDEELMDEEDYEEEDEHMCDSCLEEKLEHLTLDRSKQAMQQVEGGVACQTEVVDFAGQTDFAENAVPPAVFSPPKSISPSALRESMDKLSTTPPSGKVAKTNSASADGKTKDFKVALKFSSTGKETLTEPEDPLPPPLKLSGADNAELLRLITEESKQSLSSIRETIERLVTLGSGGGSEAAAAAALNLAELRAMMTDVIDIPSVNLSPTPPAEGDGLGREIQVPPTSQTNDIVSELLRSKCVLPIPADAPPVHMETLETIGAKAKEASKRNSAVDATLGLMPPPPPPAGKRSATTDTGSNNSGSVDSSQRTPSPVYTEEALEFLRQATEKEWAARYGAQFLEQSEASRLADTVKKVEKRMKDIEQQTMNCRRELSDECDRHYKEEQKLIKANKELKTQLTQTQEKSERLTGQLKEKQKELKRLEKRLKSESANTAEHAEIAARLEQTEKSLTQTQNKAAEESKRLNREIQKVTDARDRLHEELNGATQEIERLTNQLDDRSASIKRLEASHREEKKEAQHSLKDAVERAKKAEANVLEFKLEMGIKICSRALKDCEQNIGQVEDYIKRVQGSCPDSSVKPWVQYLDQWQKNRSKLTNIIAKSKSEFSHQIEQVKNGKPLSVLPELHCPTPPAPPQAPKVALTPAPTQVSPSQQQRLQHVAPTNPATDPKRLGPIGVSPAGSKSPQSMSHGVPLTPTQLPMSPLKQEQLEQPPPALGACYTPFGGGQEQHAQQKENPPQWPPTGQGDGPAPHALPPSHHDNLANNGGGPMGFSPWQDAFGDIRPIISNAPHQQSTQAPQVTGPVPLLSQGVLPPQQFQLLSKQVGHPAAAAGAKPVGPGHRSSGENVYSGMGAQPPPNYAEQMMASGWGSVGGQAWQRTDPQVN